MGEAGEIAHHHAEAVVEGHGDTEPVALPQADGAADEEAVVEDVPVRQRRALGQARGAAGELDVDRIAGRQGRAGGRQALDIFRPGEVGQVVEVQPTGPRRAADLDHRLQRRHPRGGELAAGRGCQFRRQGLDHADIIAGLQPLGADQGFHPDLVDRVFDLGQAIGRVDRDQDQPRPRRGELGQGPFCLVRRPDPDAIAGLEPEGEQAGGDGVGAPGQFGEGQADALVHGDQRLPVRPPPRRLRQGLANGVLAQGRAGRAADVAQGWVEFGFEHGVWRVGHRRRS